MKMRYYLGVDVGTSGCKAVVFNEAGRQVSSAYREYNVISENSGYAELDTDEVMGKCFEVIRESASRLPRTSVVGMGVSSQGEAFTLLDRDGKALCNAFVSSDARADNYVRTWPAGFGDDRLYQITGHTPHPMFSLFKLLWMKDNMPHVWSKAYKIVCFEDLLQNRLGIESPALGWSLAGRTMLFDVRTHCWSAEILTAAGIKEEQLSRPLKSGTIAGYVNKEIAKSLHISENTFIVTGGHDQPCSALGAGAINPGMAVYSAGTVECITPAFKYPVFAEELRKNNFCTYDHAVPGLYATVAFSLTGGNLLKWFRDEFGLKEKEDAEKLNRDPYELLLEKMPVGYNDLLVLPYFAPSGTPYFDTSVKGALIGMDLSTKREEIMKALLEGVAFEIRLNLEFLEQSGYHVEELRIIGGGAKSGILNQLKANVINKPITTLDITEAGCLGVAMLARAADTNQDVPAVAKNWIHPVAKIEPADHAYYDAKFREYKKLYPMLKGLGAAERDDDSLHKKFET